MPIRPENRAKYPPDWPEISRRIRFDRAQGRCECTGQCGVDHAAENAASADDPLAAELGIDPDPHRCGAVHGAPHPVTGAAVVLTTMHMDHDPENCDDANLLAGCQRCHNRYDADHRRAGIAARRPLPLFDDLG